MIPRQGLAIRLTTVVLQPTHLYFHRRLLQSGKKSTPPLPDDSLRVVLSFLCLRVSRFHAFVSSFSGVWEFDVFFMFNNSGVFALHKAPPKDTFAAGNARTGDWRFCFLDYVVR
jgi:hypothetical protein